MWTLHTKSASRHHTIRCTPLYEALPHISVGDGTPDRRVENFGKSPGITGISPSELLASAGFWGASSAATLHSWISGPVSGSGSAKLRSEAQRQNHRSSRRNRKEKLTACGYRWAARVDWCVPPPRLPLRHLCISTHSPRRYCATERLLLPCGQL